MSDDPRFIPKTEGFLAGVWYVAKEAEKQYEATKDKMDQGLNKWWWLRQLQEKLELDPVHNFGYHLQRGELITFATDFGVPGSSLHRPSPEETRRINAARTRTANALRDFGEEPS